MELQKAPQEQIKDQSHVALMCNLVDQEPTSYEEAAQKKEWVEAMTKE